MGQRTIRVGLVGAGYISAWHADALRATDTVRLAAICDVSPGAAEAMAAQHGVPAFTSVADLIASGTCDAVHILTPPQTHRALAVQCLEGGLHVLVEKPVAVSVPETQDILSAAERAGRQVHVGHNFLGLPGYERLRSTVRDGSLGRVSGAVINWRLPLPPLRSGPYGQWLLREPRNLLLEIGPHLMGFAIDLFGKPEMLHTDLSHPVELPGGDMRPQGWRILARAGHVNLTFDISFLETVDDRSVTVSGSSGRARLDYAADTLVIDRENASDLVLNPFRRQFDIGRHHVTEGGRNALRQLVSLNRKSPYGLSFRGMSAAVYGALSENRAPDPRFSGTSALAVMQALEDALALVPEDRLRSAAPAVRTRRPSPSAMVIGGTGFIGRALTRRLVADGRDVRVVSRGSTGPFPDLQDAVETVGISLHDQAALAEAMKGIDVVFNLAKSTESTWEGCLKNDVGVALAIGEAALSAGVRRLIYTGTIASYDMSDPARTITEETRFATDMSDRNLYARSKAECERRLTALTQDRGLPLVIARPGIVVGPGGPLQHWGIGRWHGAGAVRIWGNGRNILPFVLNDDVVDGLVRMMDSEDAVGQSFNLVGEPMFSARDYFDAIHAALGARIRVSPGNLHAFFAADLAKYVLKTRVLRKTGVVRPSLVDWKSRAHLTPFDNARPKRLLGWTPETDRDRFIQRAVVEANIFGF